MTSLIQQVTDLLLSDERLKSQDGQLLKNLAQELARKNDPNLISLLLSKQQIKNHFFVDVVGTLIFDKEKFIRFITSKQFLPDSYTAFKNKIGLTVGDQYIDENKDVVLVWPYKDCILEGGMTKEELGRKEIFFNETLAPDQMNLLLDPKVFTNYRRFNNVESNSAKAFNRDKSGVIKDNLVIQGNNLLVLHSLFMEFHGRVKLIYIDPPYNTGSDTFVYNDSYNHSTWLTFMKNRLEVAKELLTDDGVIVIQIDDNEQAYLKVLLDSVFTADNFVNCIAVKSSETSGIKMSHIDKRLPKIKEYLLVYKNGKKPLSINPVSIEKDFYNKDKNYLRYYTKIIQNPDDPVEKWVIVNIDDYLEKNHLKFENEEELIRFKVSHADRIVYRTDNAQLSKLKFSSPVAKVVSSSGLDYV